MNSRVGGIRLRKAVDLQGRKYPVIQTSNIPKAMAIDGQTIRLPLSIGCAVSDM
jgi:hypothetical protein